MLKNPASGTRDKSLAVCAVGTGWQLVWH